MMTEGASETGDCTSEDGQRLAAYVMAHLAAPDQWPPEPAGYPGSLALCVIDSVWSLGVHYGSVVNVVSRYRHHRRQQGADPERDNLSNLLAVYDVLGGSEGFAGMVGNNQRVSSAPNAVLKAEAVQHAARSLAAGDVDSCDDLRTLVAGGAIESTKAAWLAVPGQRSGLSWRYMLMLAKVPGVKADRWICRFVARALGLPEVTSSFAACAVTRAAGILNESTIRLDHAIWRYARRAGNGQ